MWLFSNATAVWQPKRIAHLHANLPACKSACWLNQIGQIDNRQNRLYVVKLVMPDCQLHIFLPVALHMTSQRVRPWQHNQIFPFLPVLWHTGGQGPEHPAAQDAPAAQEPAGQCPARPAWSQQQQPASAQAGHAASWQQCRWHAGTGWAHDSRRQLPTHITHGLTRCWAVSRYLQPGSHHQVVSPLPSLCMMPSFATAVKSKSPLSSLFWSDSRFQLRGDLGSMRLSAVAWVKPCNTPRRAPGRQFGTTKCSSWFGSQWMIHFKYWKNYDSLKYVAEILQSCLVIEQVWKIWNF